MASVRRSAIAVLLAVEAGRATLPDAVDRERRTLPDRRDRALLLELAAGTLRWRNAIDYVLADASTRSLEELAAPVRANLRLGVFQLRHLDRVPVHAVIHEAVELTRRTGQPRAAGFVNAVLRTVVRRRDLLALPLRPEAGATRRQQLAYLSTTLSHPEWLVARWLDRHGFDSTEAWCRFNNEPPTPAIRPLTPEDVTLAADADAAGVRLRPARHVEGAFVVDSGALGRLPDQVRARVVVQDEGSQLVALLTPVSGARHVLDLCAAPGNKTVLLSQRMGASGIVVACDVRPARLEVLVKTLARAAVPRAVVRLDAARPLPFAVTFDTVLLDAPCSGLGTLRRDPDLKWSRNERDLAGLAGQQARMLHEAARVVVPGGCLVYATCSSEPEENDHIVDAFLARHPDFQAGLLEVDGRVRAADDLVDPRGRLRTLPFRDRLDAFFAAVLVRRRAA